MSSGSSGITTGVCFEEDEGESWRVCTARRKRGRRGPSGMAMAMLTMMGIGDVCGDCSCGGVVVGKRRYRAWAARAAPARRAA